MSNRVIIVVPAYKEKFDDLEKISIARLNEVLSEFPVTFLIPESLSANFAEEYPQFSIERVSDEYFGSIIRYSNMCLSPEFYERFLRYEYMLIYQPDAFVFENRLLEFCDMGYDYIGASWECPPPYWFQGKYYSSRVGNGGFSLRKIQSCLEIVKKYNYIIREWSNPEDVFFAYCAEYLDPLFHSAPREIAWQFSMETFPQYIYRCNGNKLSFGCHGWNKVDSTFFINIIEEYGFDLTPYKSWITDMDGWDHKSTDNNEIEGRLLYRKKYSDLLSKYNHQWIFLCLDDYGFDLAANLIGDRIGCWAILGIGLERWTIGIHNIRDVASEDLSRRDGYCYLLLGQSEEKILPVLQRHDLIYGVDYVSLKKEYVDFINNLQELDDNIVDKLRIFPPGSRVLIYGAGSTGRLCYVQAIERLNLEVVGLIDQAAGDKYFAGFPVKPISEINNIAFDYCLITVKKDSTAKFIRENLINIGVAPGKIHWLGAMDAP